MKKHIFCKIIELKNYQVLVTCFTEKDGYHCCETIMFMLNGKLRRVDADRCFATEMERDTFFNEYTEKSTKLIMDALGAQLAKLN